jgi:chorismate-pyruvate lyase
MNAPADFARLDLPTFIALFPPADDVPAYEAVPADDVPEPYHGLLVHKRHMTVTVEALHGDLVDVRVLARRHVGNQYARKILLALHGSGRVVQFGIARIHLDYCTPAVRAAIVAAQTPLGRILIQHRVLRRIEPIRYLRVTTNAAMRKWFGLDRPRTTYGRIGIIHCDGRPAVEVLEIVAPE